MGLLLHWGLHMHRSISRQQEHLEALQAKLDNFGDSDLSQESSQLSLSQSSKACALEQPTDHYIHKLEKRFGQQKVVEMEARFLNQCNLLPTPFLYTDMIPFGLENKQRACRIISSWPELPRMKWFDMPLRNTSWAAERYCASLKGLPSTKTLCRFVHCSASADTALSWLRKTRRGYRSVIGVSNCKSWVLSGSFLEITQA